MQNRAAALDEKAGKLDEQGKRGADVLRKSAENLRSGADVLRARGPDAPYAVIVPDSIYNSIGRPEGSQAFTMPGGGTTFFKRSGIFGETAASPSYIIGHDSMHIGRGNGLFAKSIGPSLPDQTGSNRQRAYRFGETQESRDAFKELQGTMKGANNPDNLINLVYP